MTPNTKRILNQKVIQNAFIVPKEHRRSYVRLYFGLGVLFAAMCAIGVWLGMSWQSAGLLFMSALAVFLIMGVCYLFRAQKIEGLEYYITENTCVAKNVLLDKEPRGIDDPSLPDDHYFLRMDPYCMIDSEHTYETTEVGDRVYLLHSSKGRVLSVLNQNEWTLDTSEFVQIDEYYYFPIKGVEV